MSLQQLGPLKAEQSMGTPILHKQPGQGMEPMKMSGGQLSQLAPLRGSGGGQVIVFMFKELLSQLAPLRGLGGGLVYVFLFKGLLSHLVPLRGLGGGQVTVFLFKGQLSQ